MLTEYWAHYYADNGVKFEDEDEDFNIDDVIAQIERDAEVSDAQRQIDDVDDWEEVDLGS